MNYPSTEDFNKRFELPVRCKYCEEIIKNPNKASIAAGRPEQVHCDNQCAREINLPIRRRNMKVLKALIILFLFTSGAQAQLHIIIPEADSMTVAWEHNLTDSVGVADRITHFKMYMLAQGDTVSAGATVKDSTDFNSPKSATISLKGYTGIFYFGVSAVDLAGNESGIHFCYDATAWMGGWSFLFDITPPSLPFGSRPVR